MKVKKGDYYNNMNERNIIKIDVSGCKNWNEAQKVIELITSGKVKITIEQYE
jgi:hypothetical protein